MIVDLSQVSTRDLHVELARREGVREIVVDVEDDVMIAVGTDGVLLYDVGPIRILVNVD